MEPHGASRLVRGSYEITAERARNVSIATAAGAPSKFPPPSLPSQHTTRQERGTMAYAPVESMPPPSESNQLSSTPLPRPNETEARDPARTSSLGYLPGSPDKQHSFLDDAQNGCVPWTYSDNRNHVRSLWQASFESKLEEKARNPAVCDAIGYGWRIPNPWYGLLWRFIAFFIFCYLIYALHPYFGFLQQHCGAQTGAFEPDIFGNEEEMMRRDEDEDEDEEPDADGSHKGFVIHWAEAVVTGSACFLVAQGYYGIRAARERLERVKHSAVTLAYSFTKTTISNSGDGLNKEQLQLLIYECLALLTAFPVALLEQMRGNTCEPAISRYCRDVALTLQRLRRCSDVTIRSQAYEPISRAYKSSPLHPFAVVDHFFEQFSLQLQIEYSKQAMRTKAPSMSTQHIIYVLRNHFENLVDSRNVDDRRTPIIRENIDMMSLAGRECAIFALTDVIPLTFLWVTWLSGWILAAYCPVQNCTSIIEWVPFVDDGASPFIYPTPYSIFAMLILSIACAALTAVLAEMWAMWDPYGKGINMFAWTLGIALEIDHVLNEFYESEMSNAHRPHSYVKTPGDVLRGDEMCCTGPATSWQGIGSDCQHDSENDCQTV